MTDLTLLVLAAGMGSRYGGLKQLDPMGPAGETLLDYSVFDALRAGFNRVTFVIRRDIEDEFREKIGRRYEGRVETNYVFQQLECLPSGFTVPDGRSKPWGTAHAIWCARESVTTPFCAINADDFYGASSYEAMAGFLAQQDKAPGLPRFSMAGFRLRRTLSEHGTVARGVCEVGDGARLVNVVEYTGIEKQGTGAKQVFPDGSVREFSGEETVSMNFWGFTPAVFPLLELQLADFLAISSADPKAEFFIPMAVGQMIREGTATVDVLPTDAEWFGVTYRDDRERVAGALAALTQSGSYPTPLWS